MSDIDNLIWVANDYEREIIERVAERAGILRVRDKPPPVVRDMRFVHEPLCDCEECMVGATRPAKDWVEYEERKSG